MESMVTKRVRIDLSRPPDVVMIGVGRHGVARLRDTYSLADLWALHVYEYEGTLVLRDLGSPEHPGKEPVEIAIHPGVVTLVPPGAITEYSYEGPSEHLFAHLRLPPPSDVTVDTVPLWQQPGADLPALRDRLRAGDIWVEGSRQWRAVEDQLIPSALFAAMRDAGPLPVAVPATAEQYLAERRALLDRRLTEIDSKAAAGALEDVRIKDGELTITPLKAITPEAAWDAVSIDERWQLQQWGADAEAEAAA